MNKRSDEKINWLVMIPIILICIAVPPLGLVIFLFMAFSNSNNPKHNNIGMKKRKTPRGGWRDKNGNIIYKDKTK